KRIFASLEPYADYLWLPKPSPKADPSWFWFPIVVKEEAPFTRKEIVSFLEKVGVETRPILTGNILSQPAYSEIRHRVVGKLKQTQLILNNGFIVGLHPSLSDEDVYYVKAQFESFFQNLRK